MAGQSNAEWCGVFCASIASLVLTLLLAWLTPAVVDWLYATSIWNAASVFLFQFAVVEVGKRSGVVAGFLNRPRPTFRYALVLAPSIAVSMPLAYFLLRKIEWAVEVPRWLLAGTLSACGVVLTLLLGGCAAAVANSPRSIRWWTVAMGGGMVVFVAIRVSGVLLPSPVDTRVAVNTLALVVVDTLRADVVVGSDASELAEVANLREFARTGIACRNVYAASSWTPPSHAVLFTGTPFYAGTETRIDRNNRTLAEVFRDAGYVAVGVSANPTVRGDNGFAQGFHIYLNVYESMGLRHNPFGAVFEWVRGRLAPLTYPGSVEVTRIATRILERYDAFPVFLFLNYMDAHDPYLPTEEALGLYPELTVDDRPLGVLRGPGRPLSEFMRYRADRLTSQEVDTLKTLYRACVTDWDGGFGNLVSALRGRELAGPSMIAVTSDHGEVFGEHGGFFTHKNQLLLKELEIPLVLGGTVIPLTDRGTVFDGFLTHEGIYQLFVRIKDLTLGQSVTKLLGELALSPDPGTELAVVSAMGPTEVVRGLKDHRGRYADSSLLLTFFPRTGTEILFPESGEPDWRSGANEGIASQGLTDTAFALADKYRSESQIIQSHKNDFDSLATEEGLRELGYIE